MSPIWVLGICWCEQGLPSLWRISGTSELSLTEQNKIQEKILSMRDFCHEYKLLLGRRIWVRLGKVRMPGMTKWQREVWTQVIFSYTYATFLPYKYPSYSVSLAFGSGESTQNVTQESHKAQSFDEFFKQIRKFSLVERWLFFYIYAARMSMIDIVQVILSNQDVVTHVLKSRI